MVLEAAPLLPEALLEPAWLDRLVKLKGGTPPGTGGVHLKPAGEMVYVADPVSCEIIRLAV